MCTPRALHGRERSKKDYHDTLATRPSSKASTSKNLKPIISVKEARKLLGVSAKAMTNEELEELIIKQEQMIRFIYRKMSVLK